jgi:hypothetical protein
VLIAPPSDLYRRLRHLNSQHAFSLTKSTLPRSRLGRTYLDIGFPARLPRHYTPRRIMLDYGAHHNNADLVHGVIPVKALVNCELKRRWLALNGLR